jgi:hypothetical protein
MGAAGGQIIAIDAHGSSEVNSSDNTFTLINRDPEGKTTGIRATGGAIVRTTSDQWHVDTTVTRED